MFKTKITSAIAIAFASASVIATIAAAPASQTETPVEATTPVVDVRPTTGPAACEGEVWPYRTNGCIAAIMAENGLEQKTVRVVRLYDKQETPLDRAYAELALELRPTR